MYNYYCNNCNNIIGKWNYKYKWYDCLNLCNLIESKNFNSICFLDCKNCNKFVGLLCMHVCKNCFEEDEIVGEKKLFNWFFKYKKIIKKYSKFDYFCVICNNNDFRYQYWLFEELTFYK